jgi:hypothetical protein
VEGHNDTYYGFLIVKMYQYLVPYLFDCVGPVSERHLAHQGGNPSGGDQACHSCHVQGISRRPLTQCSESVRF